MNSKQTYHLTTIFLYLFLLVIYFQCMSCQPLAENLLKTNNDDDSFADSMWIRPLSYSDSNELNNENNESDEFLQQFLSKHLVLYNEHDQDNQSSSPSLTRRANFWKRANFWRKRANFWRRNLAS